ncbi:Oidioi.mRNA.OKI2018_I69.XSR.g13687.t1.cds [Oikopleura dioica]|uniref:Oidioi.mRNA.OKI2018_I69.XSR.g13687.t1.cds n=1 Tax=Oikopleura dioica TaxID=34765 RepID=A0ABN7S829_OIKDI|nr:Oidioi.mRNA.OKI2018_I69.XSR.g13687.t1.cds [Oikopleura dioica]
MFGARKKTQDSEHLARLQKEFETDFSNKVEVPVNRSWVRGEVVQRGNTGMNMASHNLAAKNSLYRPELQQQHKGLNQNAFQKTASPNAIDSLEANANKPNKPKFGKKTEKKKSQMEIFKEEIKAKHEAAEALKAKQKEKAKLTGIPVDYNPNFNAQAISDQGDPHSTNIFIASLSSRCTEEDVTRHFGRFGPLVSVKIISQYNCAFVAYCCRNDAERAMSKLQNTDFRGVDLKLGWGKAVPNIQLQNPLYVPDRLKWLLTPPKQSNLPLNAQPPPNFQHSNFERDLHKCTVRVVIPNDAALTRLINRTVEFVVKQGPMFEAMLMDKEANNPMFQFLYDFQCPAHSYYRWRLYSILNGESFTFWRTNRFKLYAGGPWWKPPILPFITHGMPDSDEDDFDSDPRDSRPGFAPIGRNSVSQFDDEPRAGLGASREPELAPRSDWDPIDNSKNDYQKEKKEESSKMSSVYRNEFDSALNTLTPVRDLVGDLMALCIDQVDHAQEITEAIIESVMADECSLDQRLGRIYLISDILYNGSAAPKASKYRILFDQHLEKIFEKMHSVHSAIKTPFVADQFKNRIKTLFQAWTAWSLFTNETLIKLHNIFMGIEEEKKEAESSSEDSDVDGVEIDDKPEAAESKKATSSDEDEDDVDGVPLEQAKPAAAQEPAQKKPAPSTSASGAKPAGVGSGFVASKWEARRDLRRLEEDGAGEKEKRRNGRQKEAKPLYLQSDAWRKAIRDVEVKVIEYCEQLRVVDDSIQAETYRSGLIAKLAEKFKNDPSIWEESPRSSPTMKREVGRVIEEDALVRGLDRGKEGGKEDSF